MSVDSTTTNGGPSSPMDVRLATTASATAGASATPPSQDELLVAVANGTPRAASTDVVLSCDAPGEHALFLRSAVAPDRAPDSDPAAGNDQGAR